MVKFETVISSRFLDFDLAPFQDCDGSIHESDEVFFICNAHQHSKSFLPRVCYDGVDHRYGVAPMPFDPLDHQAAFLSRLQLESWGLHFFHAFTFLN